MNSTLTDKLRKVLALTESPNENEAAAATAHLHRLLSEHNLSIADLEARGHQSKPGVKEDAHDLGKAAFKWKLDLAEHIADFYYCYSIVDRHAKTVKFLGRPDNVESLQMLYAWVIDQIKRISTDERKRHCATTGEHIDPLRWQVGFGLGAVERLIVRLNEMREQQQSDAGTGLVVHHRAEVSDYLEEKYGFRADGQETARSRKYRIEREQREAELQVLKLTDIEAYYAHRPWERPETPEQAAERVKREQQAEKREARNARNRTGRAWRDISPEQERRDAQQYEARMSGRAASSRINLQPFVEGGTHGKTAKIGS